MFEKIKEMSWVEWGAITAASAALLLLPPAVIQPLIEQETLELGPFFFSPWMHADAIETRIAMEEFSAREPPYRLFLARRAMALVGTLLYYVIGPGLLVFFGIGPASTENRSRIPFQVGLALVLAGILNLGMMSVLPRLAARQARQENAIQTTQDRMIREAFKIGHAAYQYYVLPDSLGGGGGSFAGIGFNDIDGKLDFPTAPYQLRVKSDTLLKIVGKKPCPSGKEDSIRVVARSHPDSVVAIEYQTE